MDAAKSSLLPPLDLREPDADVPVVAIVTEDAEPIYIHERRDTTEAPPLVLERAAIPAPAVAAAANDRRDTVETPPLAVASDDRRDTLQGPPFVPVTPTSPASPATSVPTEEPARGARRDTIQAPPVESATVSGEIRAPAPPPSPEPPKKAPAAPPVREPDVDDVADDDKHQGDSVARQRGIEPLRLPSDFEGFAPRTSTHRVARPVRALSRARRREPSTAP